MPIRRTILVTRHLARRQALTGAARERAHGCQVLSPDQLAARLAGGFLQAPEPNAVQAALREVLADESIALGELEGIRRLPGMARASAQSLHRLWLSGQDLSALAADGGARLQAMACLEQAVLRRLPGRMQRPQALVAKALQRIDRAPHLLGPITLRGVQDLEPVWHPLLLALANVTPVRWEILPELKPHWTREGASISWQEPVLGAPRVTRISCANPRHEALEALRWARELLATGTARPEEIAIAAPATAEWEAHIAVIAAAADLPVAFVDGRPALSSGDGQAAAALAEILLRGLSRSRVQRLLSLIRGQTPLTAQIPSSWRRIVPKDAPLLHLAQWRACVARAVAAGHTDAADLLAILEPLDRGLEAAAATGERLLAGRALSIWRKALQDGPARALDVTLENARIEDDQRPAAAIVYGSAADLAACPRPYLWLLGLTSRGWPRAPQEDALLPAHVVEPAQLEALSLMERDRRDFAAILRTTGQQLILSRSRRDAQGRESGESALLRAVTTEEIYLRRERVPKHAVSEPDRVFARPEELAQQVRAHSARTCWANWHRPQLTAHDGLLRADHPTLRRILRRPLSATRLRALVRDPLGFVWRHVLGWEAPAVEEEPLALDRQSYGNLVHRVLERTLVRLEQEGGLTRAGWDQIERAVDAALAVTVAEHEATEPVPPRALWRRTQREMRQVAISALTCQEPPLAGQCSFAEVAFGGDSRAARAADRPVPWDAAAVVRIPRTDLTVTGQIDRLDLSADRCVARVTDYKIGKPPAPGKTVIVKGGAELQRCLYAFAVQAILGSQIEVQARLLYPGEPGRLLDMEAPRERLEAITQYLVAARDHFLAGHALPGPGTAEFDSDPLRFVLPGNAKAVYLEMKRPLAALRLAPLPELWDLP